MRPSIRFAAAGPTRRVAVLVPALAAAAAVGCGPHADVKPHVSEKRHVYENQPLDRPARVTAFTPPDRVALADGRTVRLAGVRLLGAAPEGDGPLDRDAGREFGRADVLEVDAPHPGTPSDAPRRLTYRARNLYFCGNTTGVLPQYRADDLGVALVGGGVALPTPDVFASDPEYASRLADAVAHRVARPIPPGDVPTAVAVGRIMLDGTWGYRPRPGAYEYEGAAGPPGAVRAAGARLLTAAGDPQSTPRIAAAIHQTHRYGHQAKDLFDVLLERDPAAGRDVAVRMARSPKWPTWDHLAHLPRRFMAAGDWSVTDELVARLAAVPPQGREEELAAWRDLGARLEQMLAFPVLDAATPPAERYRRLVTWYRAARPRLRYLGPVEDGSPALVPAGGGAPTRDAYAESMLPYLAGTPEQVRTWYGHALPTSRPAAAP